MQNIQKNYNFFKGLAIKKCLRQFSECNLEEIPEELREQEADGSIFLVLSNKSIYGFFPNSEEFTVEIKEIKKEELPNKITDVSGNQFWKAVIDKKITEIELLYNILSSFYAIRFGFENKIRIDIQYISESNYTFDALVVRAVEDSHL